jgi:hypothetical protein
MFRNEFNQLLTRALFLEVNVTTPEQVKYTLSRFDKTLDGRTIPSLYRLYVEMADITEYEFALKYFEGWDHWQGIANSWYLKDLVAKWREEVEVKIQTEALKAIQAEAMADTKYSYAANRYLADKGWKQEAKTSRRGAGRPSKAQIQEEATRLASEAHDVNADMKRLGIN